MLEKLDMDKLQKLVYYINNVKMSGPQREQLNRVVISGILRGEIDTDELFPKVQDEESSIIRFLESEELFADEEARQGWIQANKLYEKYDRWCGAKGIEPDSLSTFGRALKDMGVSFKKKADGNYYQIDFEAIH